MHMKLIISVYCLMRLRERRVVFLFYRVSVFLGFDIILQVDDMTADLVISQLLLLDAEDSERDITLFINSPGGSITAGMFPSRHILYRFFLLREVSVWMLWLYFRDGNI